MQEKDETQAGKRRLLFKWRRWLEFNKKRERQLRALQIIIPRYLFYFIRELVNSVSASVPAMRAQLTSSRLSKKSGRKARARRGTRLASRHF